MARSPDDEGRHHMRKACPRGTLGTGSRVPWPVRQRLLQPCVKNRGDLELHSESRSGHVILSADLTKANACWLMRIRFRNVGRDLFDVVPECTPRISGMLLAGGVTLGAQVAQMAGGGRPGCRNVVPTLAGEFQVFRPTASGMQRGRTCSWATIRLTWERPNPAWR